MNILFLSLVDFSSLSQRNINTDLLREFIKNGHEVYAVSPIERKNGREMHIVKENHASILKLCIGNIQKTNIIEKGLSTLTVEGRMVKGIRQYFGNVKFDIVIYNTPPVTFCRAVEYVKKRDRAKSYLLLKDIFPQNAVDIGLLKKGGIQGALYHYFRNKEKKLYEVSDYIGCMSEANVEYVLKNNSEVQASKIEVCPNSIEATSRSSNDEEKVSIRKKYQIPPDKTVFVYGGNLGKPQGIPFLIECLRSQEGNPNSFFLIAGNGTEYIKLKEYVDSTHPSHVKLMQSLPKEDYDNIVSACDVGMIFLDYRFTIPNFPSRILTYMDCGLPVLAVTDANTDIGKIVEKEKFGYWCESQDLGGFTRSINRFFNRDERKKMGEIGHQYLLKHYTVEKSYKIIMDHFRQEKS